MLERYERVHNLTDRTWFPVPGRGSDAERDNRHSQTRPGWRRRLAEAAGEGGVMRIRALGLGLGMTAGVLAGVGVSSAAYADSTCYTGCTAPTDPTTVPTVTPTANVTSTPTGGLPFTGADIAETATVGAGLLVAGGLLVRRGRRRRVVG
jgi:hypothetical protein